MFPLSEQLLALHKYLGRAIPERLSRLYADGTAESLGLLPLATGREYETSNVLHTDAEAFADAQERFASVLGHAIGNCDGTASTPDDHLWPPGLLTIEDVGCGVYHAVDLDDAELRVVHYEHLDPVDDPHDAADGAVLAYGEPIVPRCLQHRFTVVATSLADWARRRTES